MASSVAGMRTHPALFVLLTALAATGATCRGKTETAPSPKPLEENPAPPEAAVQAPAITEIEGVSADSLPGAVRLDFWRIMNETFCYCGCPRTLASCLSNKEACSCVGCSEKMTHLILDLYRSGVSTEEVELTLLEGFAEGYSSAVRSFDVKDHASIGPETAQHTIVEFADFRCAHCRAMKPVLDRTIAGRTDTRLVFFAFPLGSSDEPSHLAAELAEEARLQGKFWELAELLFENQRDIRPETMIDFAAKAGMDTKKAKAALDARTHRAKVQADKQLGLSAQIESTPTVFIDGRRFGLPRTKDMIDFHLDIEKERGRCE